VTRLREVLTISRVNHNNKIVLELRKLDLKHAGINPKYHSVNVAEEHISHASEIYGPMMRHGEHPKRWHLVIDQAITRFKAQFAGNQFECMNQVISDVF
jgi:hypothetical protein